MTTTERDCDVLIVGAGPVGLSLAIELGQRGVRCRVVEVHDRVGYSPRAKTTNVRTREHLRRWGIADALRAASPIPPDYPPNVVFATRMNGFELARFANAFNGSRERNELYSEEAQWVPQYTLEEVLRAHAEALLTVDVTFNTRLLGLTQDAGGVEAEVIDLRTHTPHRVTCAYLVGADGARSAVRDRIGAKMQGESTVWSNYSVVFRAPALAARQSLGPAIMYWMVNGDAPAVLGPMDQEGLWFLMATKLPSDTDVASIDAAALIRKSTGLDDLAVEIVRTDPWYARSLVADFYAEGRVFLAGDACHLHPPFGGFGMNMGIGDAVDLGWKLAATLQGWGGTGLLASYEAERRPVHERTIREAGLNYATVGNQLVRPGIEESGPAGDAARRDVGQAILASKEREFRTLGLVLGARYDGSPIIVDDGTAPPPEDATAYVPSACPGSLAPHLWLRDGTSLYDGFGLGFTLLVTRSGVSGAAALVQAAERCGLPLKLLQPGDERLPVLYGAGLVLIRPDQHVAWRGDVIDDEADSILDHVRGHARSPRLR
jgi:2-polyprenyl-6-methoxyphenol hydroxylase-like FAD-dependent oxidoreductase